MGARHRQGLPFAHIPLPYPVAPDRSPTPPAPTPTPIPAPPPPPRPPPTPTPPHHPTRPQPPPHPKTNTNLSVRMCVVQMLASLGNERANRVWEAALAKGDVSKKPGPTAAWSVDACARRRRPNRVRVRPS